ncbi:MAG: YncE family protein [Mycobacteriaceae bacterium]
MSTSPKDTANRVIELQTQALRIVNDGDNALAITANELIHINPMNNSIKKTPIPAPLLSAARLPNGQLALGTDDGRILLVESTTGDIKNTINGFARVDGIAVLENNEALALDTAQTSITELKNNFSALGLALRAGEGATSLSTTTDGRVLITDTAGGALLVFGTNPLILRQRFPVPGSPFRVAYDNNTKLAWVTLSAANTVIGFDLSTGIPIEKRRFSTVQQPNSIAVDETTGIIFIGSATGGGIQSISTK